MRFFTRALIVSSLLLTACSEQAMVDSGMLATEAKVTESTRSLEILRHLPPASEKIAVAVYNFDDQTGQFKPNDKLTEYSSAVTKGGLSILNNALLSAGNKNWFTVIERGGLKNILQERQIIRAMRQQYATPSGERLPDVPPLLYAGMLIEGGIIGYDSNTVTGGAAASYFGIGGNSQYRSDRVSVYLRAVNIQTGEVLVSVTSTKTIYSIALQGNIFKYLTTDRILQAETGFTMNEPVQVAVRQAIETAVYSLIMEGASDGLWSFADRNAGMRALSDYQARKADAVSPVDMPEEYHTPPQMPRAPASASALPAPASQAVPVPAENDSSWIPSGLKSGFKRNRSGAVAPEPAPVSRAPEVSNPEPMPRAEVKSAPPKQMDPTITRDSDPNALIKYLDDSRYQDRPAN